MKISLLHKIRRILLFLLTHLSLPEEAEERK